MVRFSVEVRCFSFLQIADRLTHPTQTGRCLMLATRLRLGQGKERLELCLHCPCAFMPCIGSAYKFITVTLYTQVFLVSGPSIELLNSKQPLKEWLYFWSQDTERDDTNSARLWPRFKSFQSFRIPRSIEPNLQHFLPVVGKKFSFRTTALFFSRVGNRGSPDTKQR
jgi:hypothetical protein